MNFNPIEEQNTIVEISDYELERNKPMPDKFHAFIQKRLLVLIEKLYEDIYEVLPELNVLFKEEKKIPDLAIYKKGDIRFEHNEINVEVIPLTAIEILSDKQAISVLTSKMQIYFDAGVKSYWLVIPSLHSIYVFHEAGKYRVFTQTDILHDELTNIELDLGKIFA